MFYGAFISDQRPPNYRIGDAFLFSLFLFCFICVSSKNVCALPQTDSLLTVLRTAKEDTNKVNTLNKLGKVFAFEGDYTKASDFTLRALRLAELLKFKKGIAYAKNNTGTINKFQNNFQEALTNYFSALSIRKEIGDKKGTGAVYGNIGIVYENIGNYPEALKYYLMNLKIAEETGELKSKASALQGIGGVYKKQGDFATALNYQNEALKIEEQIGDKRMMAYSFNSIGIIYGEQASAIQDTVLMRLKLNEALKNQLKSLKIRLAVGDKNGIAMSYGNVGAVYALLGNLPEALKNQLASLKMSEEIGNEDGITNAYINLGDLNMLSGKLKIGEKYFKDALALALKSGAKDQIKECYEGLSITDSAQGNFPEAYLNYKSFILYRDSLFNEVNTKKTVQAQLQYEFDKKESDTKAEQDKKDAVANADKKRQQVILWFVVCSLLLVVGFAIFIYRGFLQKRSANIEITKQKEIIEEKQKEILDSIHYAKRIQGSLLPTEKYIDKNFKRLKKN
jgi:tetratricopeptide (TPR) repeat protein